MSPTEIPASLMTAWNGRGCVRADPEVIFWNSARELLVEEQRVLVGVDGDVRQVDRGRLRCRQFDLGLPRPHADAAGHLVLVRSMPFCDLNFHQPVDDALIPVVTTEVVVAGGGAWTWTTPSPISEQRDVEGAAAEVEDQDGLFLHPCPGRRPGPRRWAR